MAVSDYVVPVLLAGAALYALARRADVYAALTDGAAEGLKTVWRIFPSLVALLTAVYMFRASGALDSLTAWCAPALGWLGVPPETAGIMLVRPVSGSAALAVAGEIMAAHGPDSAIGRTAAWRRPGRCGCSSPEHKNSAGQTSGGILFLTCTGDYSAGLIAPLGHVSAQVPQSRQELASIT